MARVIKLSRFLRRRERELRWYREVFAEGFPGAQNPAEIGLTNVKKSEEEYLFVSGDVADIVFELEGGKYAVVEVETTDPYPGAYQVLKYKVLKCAEHGWDTKSQDVQAILVAWSIPQNVRIFCNKYGIHAVEKRL